MEVKPNSKKAIDRTELPFPDQLSHYFLDCGCDRDRRSSKESEEWGIDKLRKVRFFK